MFLVVDKKALVKDVDEPASKSLIISSNISIPQNSEYTQTIRKKYKSKPPFIMVGSGYKNNTGHSMDFIKTLTQMSKPELALFEQITDYLDIESNIGIVKAPKGNQVAQNKIYKGYKLLRAKDLVRRVQREMYMVNPDLIIPGDNYIKCKHTYDKLL